MSFRRDVATHRAAVAALIAGIERRPETVSLNALETDRYRTLAVDIRAPADLPPFTNSQMDGFAIRTADVAAATPDAPIVLPVTGHVAAGSPADALAAGEAVAVMTGAPVPAGADAILPIEDTGLAAFPAPGDPPTAVRVSAPVPVGRCVRTAGSDVPAGGLLVPAGSPVTPAVVGALAGAGIDQVAVYRPLTVLVVTTGSEVRRPGDAMRAASILDANTPALTALITAIGVRVESLAAVRDCCDAFLGAVDEAIEAGGRGVDLVVTAGGVSRGAHEVVRDALGPRGVEFGSVLMQPGGPQGLGIARLRSGNIPVVALPGNPVSALISAEVFLRPALLSAGGWLPERPIVTAPLADPVESPSGYLQLRRGRLNDDGAIELVGGASSHLLGAFARAHLLVRIPPEAVALSVGDPVTAWRING